MHRELNTMLVNNRWLMSDPTCPFCNKSNEDWKHVITCQAQAETHDRCMADFEFMIAQHKTHPPLIEYIID